MRLRPEKKRMARPVLLETSRYPRIQILRDIPFLFLHFFPPTQYCRGSKYCDTGGHLPPTPPRLLVGLEAFPTPGKFIDWQVLANGQVLAHGSWPRPAQGQSWPQVARGLHTGCPQVRATCGGTRPWAGRGHEP